MVSVNGHKLISIFCFRRFCFIEELDDAGYEALLWYRFYAVGLTEIALLAKPYYSSDLASVKVVLNEVLYRRFGSQR